MNLNKDDIKFIETAFHKMKNKSDLLDLINYSKKRIYGENSHRITLIQLNYHLVPTYNNNRYKSFVIKKKSGGSRVIYSPNKGLKVIQKCLNLIFQIVYPTKSKSVMGFVPGRSIVDNAKVHSNRNYVFNIDLKDFFNSIDQARIWGKLQVKPFNFSKKEGKLELANVIAALCCHPIEVERFINDNWIKSIKNVLPQGAPTSPFISNLICERLDYYLTAIANRFSLKYTRYVDDITFSSDHNVYQIAGEFRNELERVIKQEGFYFNPDKTRLQRHNFRQEVTGVIVNEKTNVNRRFIKQLKKWIYLWENYGYFRASEIFIKEYSETKLNINSIPNLEIVVRGKLNYLKMVKGNNDSVYTSLHSRYLTLLNGSNLQTSSSIKLTAQLPILHDPESLVIILKKFTTNNTALKYSTHTWDGGKDNEVFDSLEEFILKARQEYNQFSKKLKSLSSRLDAKIATFLFAKDFANIKRGWGMFNIRFGWNSEELHKFLKDDPRNIPENFVLPDNYKMGIKRYGKSLAVTNFKNVIDIFKNEIEIRDENNILEEMVISLHKKYLNGFDIKDISNLNNKNFYTDVDYIYKALELIFQNIQKRPQYPNIIYKGYDEQEYFCLKITHCESNAKGKSYKDSKFMLKEGDFGTISNYLKNLCDWSIESLFLEGHYRINFLSAEKKSAYENISSSEGFSYILKFYK